MDSRTKKTILGAKLRLFAVMFLLWIGWGALSLQHFPASLGVRPGVASALFTTVLLGVVLAVLASQVYLNRRWAKTALTQVSLLLVAAAVYFPFFPRILAGAGLISPDIGWADTSFDAGTTEDFRLAVAASVLELTELWPNLLILICAGALLNQLRAHTILRLWDYPDGGSTAPLAPPRVSIGNSLVIALFLTLAFYALLVSLPDSPPLFLGLKRLFIGNHAIYYVLMLVFWWAATILASDYLAVLRERRHLNAVKGLMSSSEGSRITPALALSLLTAIEQRWQPVHQSQVVSRVHEVLSERVLAASDAVINRLQQRLDDIDFQRVEITRGFLNTMLWSLPLLGFMGTIMGIIQTIGAFSGVLSSGKEAAALLESLSGLSLAFETTLIGLVAALIGGYLLSVVRRDEAEINAEMAVLCQRRCLRNGSTVVETGAGE